MNDGFVNEEDIIDYLNNKKFDQLNTNFQFFLKSIFNNAINRNSIFVAENCGGNIKPDISIFHDGQKKYISIKKGSGNSVHQEPIEQFFHFFENLTNENALNLLKLFHYADDTYDDSGQQRYNSNQAKARYKNQIKQLNLEINNKDILLKFIDRFLFYGNISPISVDYIYHGNLEFGYWASKDEITNYILNNKFDLNAVHFGPLTYQVWGRNHNKTAKYPERRYVMQIKWGTLTNDLIKIRKEVSDDF